MVCFNRIYAFVYRDLVATLHSTGNINLQSDMLGVTKATLSAKDPEAGDIH